MRTFRFTRSEIRFEKALSGILLVTVPVPCLAAGLMLAADGFWRASWVFLAVSVALELMISIERGLLLRALEAFRVDAWEGHVRIVWPGGSRELELPLLKSVRAARGLLPGSPPRVIFQGEEGALSLPVFSEASLLTDFLRGEGTPLSVRFHFPPAAFAAVLALAAGAACWYWLGAHPALALSVALCSLPAVTLAFPLHRVLGPEMKRLEASMAALLCLVVAGLLAVTLASVPPADFFRPAPRLPAGGAQRSAVIFALGAEGRAGALANLLALARSEDPLDRRDALLALSLHGGRQAAQALGKAVEDPEAEVRRAAAAGLGLVDHPHRDLLLITLMAKDSDMAVVREADASLRRFTGYSFKAGGGSSPLSEDERMHAVFFWRQALFPESQPGR